MQGMPLPQQRRAWRTSQMREKTPFLSDFSTAGPGFLRPLRPKLLLDALFQIIDGRRLPLTVIVGRVLKSF